MDDLLADAGLGGFAADVPEDFEDELTDAAGVFFFEAAAGYGGGAETDTAGGPGGLGIVGDGVSVDYDVGPAERFFRLSAGDVEGAEVNEGHVVVGAARDESEATIRQGVGQDDGIGPDLSLVLDELFGHRFGEGDGLGRDGVLHGAALGVGEHGAVDGAGVVGVAKDHAAAWTSERLMGGGGDYLGLTDR